MATRQIPKVQGERRERTGTRYAQRLRQGGRLPAIVYGHKQDAVPVAIDYRQFTDLVHQHHHLLELEFDSEKEACLIKQVQWNHLGTQIVHVDLTRVDMSEEVEIEMEVTLTGEPAALREEGAILNHPETSITIACRADQIPETLQHDISELSVGESVTVADLKLPDGVRAVSDPEMVLANIQIMQEEPEEEPVAGEGEEPEVIGKAEESEEGEESKE
jgi:large subunit ribosomal protein L25